MTILITGISAGIGRELMLEYSGQEHQLILISRPGPDTDDALDRLVKADAKARFDFFACDLSEPSQIMAACVAVKKKYEAIDILINNAAVYPAVRTENSEGLELTFAVNVLAPYLLMRELLCLLRHSKDAQIINISSIGERYASIHWDDLMSTQKYDVNQAYNNSKRLLTMLTFHFAKTLQRDGILVNALHPGATNSGLVKPDAISKMPWVLRFIYKIARQFNNSPRSAARAIALFIHENQANKWTGCFISKKKRVKPSADARNKAYQERITETCEALVNR